MHKCLDSKLSSKSNLWQAWHNQGSHSNSRINMDTNIVNLKLSLFKNHCKYTVPMVFYKTKLFKLQKCEPHASKLSFYTNLSHEPSSSKPCPNPTLLSMPCLYHIRICGNLYITHGLTGPTLLLKAPKALWPMELHVFPVPGHTFN